MISFYKLIVRHLLSLVGIYPSDQTLLLPLVASVLPDSPDPQIVIAPLAACLSGSNSQWGLRVSRPVGYSTRRSHFSLCTKCFGLPGDSSQI